MKVRVSSGKLVDDLYAAAEPSPAQQPGLHRKPDVNPQRLFVAVETGRKQVPCVPAYLLLCRTTAAAEEDVCPSPGLGDLLVWDRRPHRLAVPLLFELAAESLLYVVHVEGTDSRTGDAGEETR